MAVANTKKKKLTKEVFGIIRNDIPLREKIAKALNIENNSVYAAALRESLKLSLPFIVDLIAKHTGKCKEEILDNGNI